MFARYTAALLGTASVIALAHPSESIAQQTSQGQAAAAPPALEEVVVTARRREEKAQTVPITITTLTQKALEVQAIHAPNDLNKAVPAIQLCCNRGAVSFAWIRGVPGVLGYFNQLPTLAGAQDPSGLNGSAFYFDLGNLQVLKGPQGTLFGISTNGGAILFESKKPTNSFEGYVQVGAGSYGHVETEAVINVPIIPDKLLLRAGAQFQTTDGYLHDVRNNRDFYDETYGVARISVTARPTDDIQDDFVINAYRSHNHSTAFVWTAVNPAGVSLLLFRNAPFIDGAGHTEFGLINAFNQQLALGKYSIIGSDASGKTFANLTQLNIQNTTSWDVNDNLTIKNIAGYQEFDTESRTDTDGTPFAILDGNTLVKTGVFAGQVLHVTQERPNVTYTEELQGLGKLFNDRVTYTIGAFNYWQALRSPDRPGFSSTAGSVGGAAGIVYYSARANAVYVQSTFDLSDWIPGLSFTGGYRYNWDKKEFRQDSYSPTLASLTDPTLHRLTASVGLVGQFHAPTYLLNLQYQLDPTTMFYVQDSKGYTTGGFNTNGPPGLQLYQPEYLDNVEIGVKSDWTLGGVKARTNLSAFYGMYDNVQTQLPVAVSPTVFQVLTTNAATAHIQGIEAQVTVVPTESVEFGLDGAYTYNNYDTYLAATPQGVVNMNNTPFTDNPRWNGTIHVGYYLPVPEDYGRVKIGADLHYQSRESTTPSLPRLPTYDVPGFENLDINIDWEEVMGRQGLSATAYITNVTGNVWTNGPFQVYSALGVFGIAPAAPTMFGFRVRYEFGE